MKSLPNQEPIRYKPGKGTIDLTHRDGDLLVKNISKVVEPVERWSELNYQVQLIIWGDHPKRETGEIAQEVINLITSHQKALSRAEVLREVKEKIVDRIKYDYEHKFTEAYWWTRGDDVTRTHAYKECFDDTLAVVEEIKNKEGV